MSHTHELLEHRNNNESSKDIRPMCILSISPTEGTLSAGESITITLTIKPQTLGLLSTVIPLRSALPLYPKTLPGAACSLLALRVSLCSVGAALRLGENELNMGLLKVGASSQRHLTMTNESAVPAMYDLSIARIPLASAAANATATALAQAFARRKSSVARRHSSTSKGGLSRASSRNSVSSSMDGSFRLDEALVVAQLSILPNQGSILPGESVAVIVTCTGGQLPEHVRALVECRLHSIDDFHFPFPSSYIRLRAEIQAPTVRLSAAELCIGTAYIGSPIHLSITLTNLSHLEAPFAWERPGGIPPQDFSISFEPAKGVLMGSQSLVIDITYTALTLGTVEDVMACRVFGMANPVGLVIRGRNRAVTFCCEIVPEGGSAPAPLQPETALQWELDSEGPPEPSSASTINLPNVPLMGRETVRVAVRNLSGLPAQFVAGARKYNATAPPARLLASRMNRDAYQKLVQSTAALEKFLGGTTGEKGDAESVKSATRQPLLDNLHEAVMFTSGDGRERSARRLIEREDMYVLREGKGIALQVYPAEGTIPPWGVAELRVTLHNDTPGRFFDDVVVSVAGSENGPVRMQIRCTVGGCPLSLKPECLGLSVNCQPNPLLSFGEVFEGGTGATRILRVRNSGTVPAELTWSLHSAATASGGDQLVELSIVPAKGIPRMATRGSLSVAKAAAVMSKVISLAIKPLQRPAFHSPFIVDPPIGIVPPRKEAIFRVVIPDHLLGDMSSMLVADATWGASTTAVPDGGNANRPNSPKSPSPRRFGAEGNSSPTAVREDAGRLSVAVGFADESAQQAPGSAAASPSNRVRESVSGGGLVSLLSAARAVKVLKAGRTAGASLPPTRSALKLLVTGIGVVPRLRVDVRKTVDVSGGSRALHQHTSFSPEGGMKAEQQHLKFSVSSAELAEGIEALENGSQPPASLVRSLTFTNPLSVPLPFKTEFTGPFQAHTIKLGATADPRSRDRGGVRTTSQAATIVAVEAPAQTILPGRSLTLDIVFIPPSPLELTTSTLTAGSPSPLLLHQQNHGSMEITFGTGHTQTLGLIAHVLRPTLSVAPPQVHYGAVHVEAHSSATLYLANPTQVDAPWSLHHMPRPPPKRIPAGGPGAAPAEPISIDDPSVFTFSEERGLMKGPSLPLSSSAARVPDDTTHRLEQAVWGRSTRTALTWRRDSALTLEDSLRTQGDTPGGEGKRLPRPLIVMFKPKAAVLYKCRFRVQVEHGESVDIVLEGLGTLDEFVSPAVPPRV